jgi:putative transposase
MPEFAELQRQLNRALAGRLPRALCRRRQRLAIDLTLIPYHGEHFRDPKEVYRGQAKSGTSHFHAYATAYVVLRGQRFTVALTAVAKERDANNFPICLEYDIKTLDRSATRRSATWTPMHRESNG